MSQAGEELVRGLEALVPAMRGELASCAAQDLEDLRVKYLGRKGLLAGLLAGLGSLAPEDRPLAGKAANAAKQALTDLFAAREAELAAETARGALSRFDPTLPGRTPEAGSLHPVTLVMEEICTVFTGLGFEVVSGPEVESDWYNFEALNLPPEHPARDMQDTLYVADNVVLRTHTSPLQVRTMLARKPPVAVIAPGKVYRRDSDLTHTPMFHQIEGLLVDREVSMADLRGTLTSFLRQIFGVDTRVRFRPSFFPFTEPSAEVDISCRMCGGAGTLHGEPCRVCKQTGWVEILGCGMVDPEVFKAVGYDPEVYTGFAFGLGVERVTMLKYGIGDLRMFFENDTRFLGQFA
ncbi:phenylalanine--tRNA ligase subunit alpha [Desulfocurvus vexinensis]|uniref:phenylalanine--tRNA ligase subunit alpha n=1 Tax=Desulfocurvus vexinensis TaxID=399548 RepID=UPI00048D15AC|nr:phenylalanine--tRNA ligase subunit alpha [Desulfocurvus vexinensis]